MQLVSMGVLFFAAMIPGVPDGHETEAVAEVEPMEPASEKREAEESRRRFAKLSEKAVDVQGEGAGVVFTAVMSTASWCADQMTICWAPPQGSTGFFRRSLSGFRLTVEPGTTGLFQSGGSRLERGSLLGTATVGAEINLFAGWISAQAQAVLPFDARLEFNGDAVAEPTGPFRVHGGVMLGGTLLNGVVAAGWGRLFHDGSGSGQFAYVGIQPVTMARIVIMNLSDRSQRRRRR